MKGEEKIQHVELQKLKIEQTEAHGAGESEMS